MSRSMPWWSRLLVCLTIGVVASSPGATAETTTPCEEGAGKDCAAGDPIDVFTGNAWLNQTDAVIPGVNAIVFTRSYSSADAYAGKLGAFGRGWTDTFEQKIVPTLQPGVIFLRIGTSSPMYFYDRGGDGSYKATVPITEKSWIVQQADGHYERHLVDGTIETFDAGGQWIRSADAVGNVTTIGRDALGRVASVTDAGGRSITFQYTDSSRRIATLTGPLGVMVTYDYYTTGDSAGWLQKATYADGSGYAFTYDELGQLLTVTDHSGRTIETHGYVNGKGTVSEIADGRERVTVTYADLLTTAMDALGHPTTYEFANVWGSNHIAKITRGSEVKRFSYDSKGRLAMQIDAAGGATKYEYYSSGRLSSVTDPLGRSTRYGYDDQGRTNFISYPNGAQRRIAYAAAGPSTVTDTFNGDTSSEVRYTYTGRGQIATVVDARGETTGLTYTPAGDLETVTDPLGRVTHHTYDAAGREIETKDPLDRITQTEYDAAGRVSKVTRPDGSFVTFSYDLGGRLLTTKESSGQLIANVYDPYGRLVSVRDAADRTTAYEYDFLSQLTSVTDARGNRTAYEYDGVGHVTKTTFPDTTVESYTYDTAGRLWKRRDRKGTITTYVYDALARVTARSYSDGTPPVSFAYDAAGQLETASNAADTLTWTRDPRGRILRERSRRNNTTLSYTYDLNGQRTSATLGSAFGLTYTYDDAGQLKTIARGASVFRLEHNGVGLRQSLTDPSGVLTTYTYDLADHLTRINASLDGTVVSSAEYTHDAGGNRKTKITPEIEEAYDYDGVSQLVKVSRAASQQEWRYAYDAVGNRVSRAAGSMVTPYSYNESNELIAKGAGAPLRVAGRLDEAGTVTVQGRNARMLPGNGFEASLAVPSGDVISITARDGSGNQRTQAYEATLAGDDATFTYDADGNRTGKLEAASQWSYEWDAESHLKRVLKNGHEVASFEYDPLGRRVVKNVGGASTAYTYDDTAAIRETTPGATRYYIHSLTIDEVLADERAGGALRFYHADGLGSIVRVTDQSGAVTEARQYGAFGELESGRETPGYAFTGREWDPETELYYYRARYYDPTLGRFISEDPTRFSAGVNFYNYVGANPTNLVDPNGLSGATLTKSDCGAARRIVQLERRQGSNLTALFHTGHLVPNYLQDAVAALGFSRPQEVQLHAYAYQHPQYGQMDLDYVMDLEAVNVGKLGAFLGFPFYQTNMAGAYVFEKLANQYLIKDKTLNRDSTYPLPFQDPGEVNVVKALAKGATFEDILGPFLNCKCGG